MIFVDTSVWISYFRGPDPELRRRLDSLLDEGRVALAEPVRLELLSGASRRETAALKRVLSALPCFRPDGACWDLAENWVVRAVEAGQRFGFADLLIAVIATQYGGELWSLDGDFRRMAKLKWIRAWPG